MKTLNEFEIEYIKECHIFENMFPFYIEELVSMEQGKYVFEFRGYEKKYFEYYPEELKN